MSNNLLKFVILIVMTTILRPPQFFKEKSLENYIKSSISALALKSVHRNIFL